MTIPTAADVDAAVKKPSARENDNKAIIDIPLLKILLKNIVSSIGSAIIGDVPIGGTTGQILTKASNANLDADWEDISLIAPDGEEDQAGTNTTFQAGNGGVTTGNNSGQPGGDLAIQAGTGSAPLDLTQNAGNGGATDIYGGSGENSDSGSGGNGGSASLNSGFGGTSSEGSGGDSGAVNISAAVAGWSSIGDPGNGGDVRILAGYGGDATSAASEANSGNGGDVFITAGVGGANSGHGDSGNGGGVFLIPGAAGNVIGDGSEGSGGVISLFAEVGLKASERPTITTQVATVDVAAFNALCTALIKFGLVINGD